MSSISLCFHSLVSAFSKIIQTPNPYPNMHHLVDSQVNITQRQRVKFAWRACSDAIVLLSSNYLSTNPSIEIFLGGWNNAKSGIR